MSTLVEVPARVVFINVKDGNAFFDCTPAEARLASKLIKEMREVGESNLDFVVKFRSEIEAVVNAAVSATESDNWTVGGVSAFLMSDGFKVLEERDVRVSHIVMNAYEYAAIRKFDRDCINVVTEMWKLRAGVMAIMWGALIIVSREVQEGTMVFCAMEEEEPEFFRLALTYSEGCERGLPPKKELAGDALLHEKIDRILALISQS